MITAITVGDVEQLKTELGDSFYNECGLPGGFKIEAFIHNWTLLIKGNIGVMWKLSLDGMSIGFLGGVLLPDVNNGELVATEMFWYVHPNHRKSLWGIRLYSTFEAWARQMGAKRIVMAHVMNPSGDTLKKFYIRRGFTPVETHYSKDLS